MWYVDQFERSQIQFGQCSFEILHGEFYTIVDIIRKKQGPHFRKGGCEDWGCSTGEADNEFLSDRPYFESVSFFLVAVHCFLTVLFRYALRSVTMAQCTRSFVKGENYGFSESGKAEQAAFA